MNTAQPPFQSVSSVEAREPVDSIQLDGRTLFPFAAVGLLWWLIGIGVCLKWGNPAFSAIRGLSLLWAFCLFDLYALARAIGAMMGLSSAEGEKRGPLLIQASYWGLIKLACLGILGTILLYGSSIPSLGLLMGSATLVVVPLVGGYWWSQKVLHHA